jgi:hypothetical protein
VRVFAQRLLEHHPATELARDNWNNREQGGLFELSEALIGSAIAQHAIQGSRIEMAAH